MIAAIKELHNLGKYENFIGNQKIGNKQIIFGFNGTGKSTLSDMFYSMINNEILSNRKTLDKDDGRKAGDIKIILGTDTEDIIYDENVGWDKKLNIHTFNEQYIKDYVFVNKEYNQEILPITIGAEGVKLANLKQEYIDDRNGKLKIINAMIKENKELCGNIGLGKVAVKGNNIKRLQNIKELKLFSPSEKNIIQDKMKRSIDSSKEIICINECMDIVQNIKLRGDFISVAELRKIIESIPCVKNKEINQHMKSHMKHGNIKWLIAGCYNQVDKMICPYCGQKIASEESKRLISELNRFIATKMQIKAKTLIEEAKKEIQIIDLNDIKTTVNKCNDVITKLRDNNLININLYKNMYCEIEKFYNYSDNLEKLLQKLWRKIENPYKIIKLEEGEVNCIKVVNTISKNIPKIESSLRTAYNRMVQKAKSEKETKKREALFEASYGANREQFINMKNQAIQVLKLNEKIDETTEKLDDAFNQIKLDKINILLRELNIKFKINVRGKQYFIKLGDYVDQKYDKNDATICSEGEKRILAFAYFLSEISDDSREKIIVIDDPITSLDLNRKSVIAYRISELFADNSNQTIIMTHDISFVEQIRELSMKRDEEISMIELKNNENIFSDLNVQDYLISEEKVYSSFINNVNAFSNNTDRIIALMSLRPYTYIVNRHEYSNVEKKSTYFAHTIYSKNKGRNIEYDKNQYDEEGLRKLINDVRQATGLEINMQILVPENYVFNGFDYNTIRLLYDSIKINNVVDARKKAMLLRIFLEACLFQLTSKQKFNPERIGLEYKKVIKGCSGEKKKMAKKLKELYDLSKKYHHGAEDGSTLGLSYINPDEIEFFDSELQTVVKWIDNNCKIKEKIA